MYIEFCASQGGPWKLTSSKNLHIQIIEVVYMHESEVRKKNLNRIRTYTIPNN